MDGACKLSLFGHLLLLLLTHITPILCFDNHHDLVWNPYVQNTHDVYIPPVHGPIKTPFVIISMARSATNSLIGVLDSNDKLQCFYEAFNNRSVYAFEWEHWTPEKRDANRTAFMERLFTVKNPKKPKTRAQGFKIFPLQVSEREYLGIVGARHVKKIVIMRKDDISQYVSAALGHKTGYWSQVDKGREMALETKVAFDMTHYNYFMSLKRLWYEYAFNQARDYPSSWLFLTTEEITTDKYALMKIYDHLRLAEGNAMEYHPYTSQSLADKLSNYDEIWERLGLPPPPE